MMKKSLAVLILILSSALLTSGCNKSKIVTSTGQMGHRTDKYKAIAPASSPNSHTNVIYLGKEYGKDNFGPNGVRFVFD